VTYVTTGLARTHSSGLEIGGRWGVWGQEAARTQEGTCRGAESATTLAGGAPASHERRLPESGSAGLHSLLHAHTPPARASLAGRANSDTFDMTPRLVSHSDQCLLILTFPIRACFLLGLGVQRAWAQSVPHVHLALHTTHL
jgi:hypothetical protein